MPMRELSILPMERRAFIWLVSAVLGLAFGPPLTIRLCSMSLPLERIEVGILVSASLCLLLGPLVILIAARSSFSAATAILSELVTAPLIVVVRGAESTRVAIPCRLTIERLPVEWIIVLPLLL